MLLAGKHVPQNRVTWYARGGRGVCDTDANTLVQECNRSAWPAKARACWNSRPCDCKFVLVLFCFCFVSGVKGMRKVFFRREALYNIRQNHVSQIAVSGYDHELNPINMAIKLKITLSCYDRCQLYITRNKQPITTYLSVNNSQSECPSSNLLAR